MKVAVGDKVQQIVKPIVGEVKDLRWSHSNGGMEALVTYTGEDNEPHERWFMIDDMEVVQ